MNPTVFVLEDDCDISRLVQYHLQKSGFVVKVYETGRTIVADAEEARPALFLLDVMVPDGDGMDVCRRIRQNPLLESTPIIFLTARAMENDRVRGLEMGADDYITKPFGTRELVAESVRCCGARNARKSRWSWGRSRLRIWRLTRRQCSCACMASW